MAVNLTEGVIAQLSSGEAQANNVKPVLQVTDMRAVNTQNQNNNERYRLLLSDGSYFQQGMLATQLNDLVRSGRLQKGSIVQLTEFVCQVFQDREIIIIINLDVILGPCDSIGEPQQYPPKAISKAPLMSRPSAPVHPTMNQPGAVSGNPSPHSYSSSFCRNPDSGPYNPTKSPVYPNSESNPGFSRSPYRPAYPQSASMYTNRGPEAKNEAASRIIPIAALNPYQGRWTIKARVTLKGELRQYSNARGDGKVFSFDLLDSDGGEIRVTCFNAVAEQFYYQIEVGKVYLISKGSLKPAQKNFNHLRNDHEILLESTSTVQLCSEGDSSIPEKQFNFRPITEIESMESNSIIDVIGVLCSISPSSSIMRKNGTETQKRVLHLKDMSGRTVEVTLWGNFCNAEGQTLQNICDSGVFPVLALKSGRVNDFNGKTVGTISTSQLFIEPDLSEARKLKAWIENEGKNAPVVSISREPTVRGRADVRKTVSQIKDEKLGTSKKPDWITVIGTLSYMNADNFSYTACPIMIGDGKCSKKVTNNGDGTWHCDRCNQSVDECDHRYIIQFQIQDHTGLTWATAFQESGEDIMGVSAKELFSLKFEEQDDERFADILHKALFDKYIFTLKVKEDTYNDEQRVKSTLVKAEKLNYISETRYLLDLVGKLKDEDSSSPVVKASNVISNRGLNNTGFGNVGLRQPTSPVTSSSGNTSFAGQGFGVNLNAGSTLASTGPTDVYMSCSSCKGTGHSSTNCLHVMNGRDAGGFSNQAFSSGGGGTQAECYKCHQQGHWARDCPGVGNVPSAYGGSGGRGGAQDECYKCHQQGHWAGDCPGVGSVPPAYGGGGGGVQGECYKCHQQGHWARDCPGVGNVPPAYGRGGSGGGGQGECYKCHQQGHWARDCTSMGNARPSY